MFGLRRYLNPVILGLSISLLAFSSAGTSFGGEILIDQKFEDLNLDELPPGWSRAERPMLSIVEEEGHGKVLKLSNRDEHYPFVAFNVDPLKAAGKIVRVSISARFPGAYVPIADKLAASPKYLIEAKDDIGNMLGQCELIPQAGKPDWQELKKDFTIPAKAVTITASVCIQFVTAEVSFDNMMMEVIGESAPAAAPPVEPAAPPPPVPQPPATPAAPLQVATPATPAAPADDPNSPAGRAAKSPRKVLADDGMSFSPESSTKLQAVWNMKKATALTVMYVGPGFVDKEPLPKLASGWKAVPLSLKLSGKSVSPRALLSALPEALVKEKPEVVLISGDETPGRKATTTEAEDWEDIARLCSRYGAVPVFVMQGPTKDEAHENVTMGMKKAMDVNNILTISAIPQEVYLKRVSSMLALLDQHVFMRGKTDGARTGPDGVGKPGKVVDE